MHPVKFLLNVQLLKLLNLTLTVSILYSHRRHKYKNSAVKCLIKWKYFWMIFVSFYVYFLKIQSDIFDIFGILTKVKKKKSLGRQHLTGCFWSGRSVMLSAGWESSSTMSTSDSDYSIDWLASDEDDDSLKSSSPQQSEDLPVPPPSSSSLSLSTTSLRKSPTSSFRSGATQRSRSDCCDCKDEGVDSPVTRQTPAFGPLQRFTSVCTQQTLSVESKYQSTRKRAHSTRLHGLCEKPQPDTENELFSHKVRGLIWQS